MGLLFTEILICLLVAFLLGLLVGWLIWGRNRQTETVVADDSKWVALESDLRARIKSGDAEISGLKAKISGLEADLAACHASSADLSARLTSQPIVEPAPAVVPSFASGLMSVTEDEEGTVLPETPPELPSWMPKVGADERDDLKEIKGVGPFLEKKLNAFGIHTFRQVAVLTKDNIKELGDTFGSFPDRIEREKWAEQAVELHALKYGNGNDLPEFTK